MKTAYLSYTTPNIGDDVQSIALEEILGTPDEWINRDHFDQAPTEDFRLVANGWFVCGPFPPPANIRPTYVGICSGGLNGSMPEIVNHLKDRGPIGCRDRYTLEWCEARGIESYFSSCPTILMKRTIPYNPDGPIVVVDLNPCMLPHTLRPVRWLSNKINPAWFPDSASRRAECRKRLKLYQEASLVITHRLHVAMPCLGFGTPVIVTRPYFFPRRHTALPESIRIHDPHDLKEMDLSPELHLHDVTNWKAMVRERLFNRLEKDDVQVATVS